MVATPVAMNSRPNGCSRQKNMSAPEASDTSNGDAPQKRRVLRRLGFWCVNAWLIKHLTAIIAAPATVGPSSQTARNVWEVVGPYLEVFYLNHGFHYFSPQPGSSNLVSWTATLEDGSTKSGRFPNFDITPRLYYHRHFMLSEFQGNADPELQRVLARG